MRCTGNARSVPATGTLGTFGTGNTYFTAGSPLGLPSSKNVVTPCNRTEWPAAGGKELLLQEEGVRVVRAGETRELGQMERFTHRARRCGDQTGVRATTASGSHGSGAVYRLTRFKRPRQRLQQLCLASPFARPSVQPLSLEPFGVPAATIPHGVRDDLARGVPLEDGLDRQRVVDAQSTQVTSHLAALEQRDRFPEHAEPAAHVSTSCRKSPSAFCTGRSEKLNRTAS